MSPSESLHRLLTRRALFGPFSKTSDPSAVEAMGWAGMDFVIIDLEHGPNDISNLAPLIMAAERSGLLPVVRVSQTSHIGRALDLGAAAVQIPHVANAQDAENAVQAARFAPEGNRGVCRFVRAAHFGETEKSSYFTEANRISVIAQVEGKEGLENLPSIIKVPGIDVIFVGVYDLSQSLGVTGQTDHPEVENAMWKVVETCRSQGIPVGTFVESVSVARRYQELGVRYLCYSVDIGILAEACRGILSELGGNACDG